jgi:hypothetical protein
MLAKAGLQHLGPNDESTLADWWQQTRTTVLGIFRHGFDSTMLLVSWGIWKERNRRTFDNSAKTPAQVLALICEEADSWISAGFRSLASLVAIRGGTRTFE